MSNPEFVREYEFKDGLCIRCRSNCCLFCLYCTDIFYDWHGPYAIICEKKIPDGFITGMSGKCKSFYDVNNNEKIVLEDAGKVGEVNGPGESYQRIRNMLPSSIEM